MGTAFVDAQTPSRAATSVDSATRDNFGMYASNVDGPGPGLMGANTLLGNDVYNKEGEDLGDIKEFMVDMDSGEVAYAVLSFGGRNMLAPIQY